MGVRVVIFIWMWFGCLAWGQCWEFEATKIIDGDTYRGVIDLGFGLSQEMDIRLKDLDTPEIFRPKSVKERVRGYAAKKFVQELKGDWELCNCKKGKYYRQVCEVYIGGESLKALLIENDFKK